ncbi:Hypothetical_protein [Hexamita inflata]|uniref:Hypothetical_protein n=1 Tax=Hexamita inflata TaxID=28002 RepID=A0AA86PI13_9EUKA|nr:Hypothetical protein HINF_LOCUS23286 [Hexamita inflata]CAI9935644.1 Hypothetical protein HINF_LOCUS23289 [Hexamita inflata]CAI9940610.1 Hypothetical protein HINF_LOCUS28255 [Hexamita inflata]
MSLQQCIRQVYEASVSQTHVCRWCRFSSCDQVEVTGHRIIRQQTGDSTAQLDSHSKSKQEESSKHVQRQYSDIQSFIILLEILWKLRHSAFKAKLYFTTTYPTV